MRSELDVDVAHIDGSVVVVVQGEVDVATAPTLFRALQDLRAGSHVLVDMGNVGFIDSSGLRVLAAQALRMIDAGGSLHLSQASSALRRVLVITSLEHLLLDPPPPRMAC